MSIGGFNMHLSFIEDYNIYIIPDYKDCYYLTLTESDLGLQTDIKYPFGSFLVDFANLDVKYTQDFLQKSAEKLYTQYYTDTPQTFEFNGIKKVLNNICSIYSDKKYAYLGFLLASDIIDRLEEVNYSPSNVNDLLFPNIIYLEELKNLSIKLINHDYGAIDQWDYDLITNTQIILNIEDPLSPTSYYSYKIKKISDIIAFDNINYHKNNTTIKLCQNCGKFFIPSSRSDEIYCDNIYENGKTCKEIGYEVKLKNDEFKTSYRRAYKTQRARISYNRHITNYEELHFKPWEKAAKQALADFSSKKDIDGFQKWLKDNKDLF